MNVKLAYHGHSGVASTRTSQTLALAPNLAREPVSFGAPLLHPLRFREAISALHDVVVSDLRFKQRDPGKVAYAAWKQQQLQRESTVRREVTAATREAILTAQTQPIPRDIGKQFEHSRKRYWAARMELSNYLRRHDQETWRLLMPCDPVITIAPDVALFECFSGDESSYGCLSVTRDAFGPSNTTQLGTTNVDYSWELYHHFQALRSYRETRFRIDPEGFESATGASPSHREEKIDLPTSWLQGFVQLQSAMTLPTTRLTLSRDTVYSLLAWLKRHRAWTSPRALRFELVAGQPIKVAIEPWNVTLTDPNLYDGPPTEPIRVWGARRVLSLARSLPLAERFDLQLLGTGLPHFWLARMGEMTLTLGLSGWTVNDWTRSAALDLIAPPAAPTPEFIATVAALMTQRRSATFAELQQSTGSDSANLHAALRHLAQAGQLIHDLTTGQYRWRQIMPQPLGEAQFGPPHPELLGLAQILTHRRTIIESVEPLPKGGKVVKAKVDGTPTELMIDNEDRIKRGKCLCGHYRKFGLKNGPCRHMMAARMKLMAKEESAT